MKATRLFMFLVMVICLASGVKAQFNSSQVYCYQFLYSMEDGIKSHENEPNPTIYFVIFQNGYMLDYMTNKNEVIEHGGAAYFEKQVKDKFADCYHEINSVPKSPFGTHIFAYDSSLSSGDTYTYRWQKHHATTQYSSSFGYTMSYRWTGKSWEKACYSFSTDKENMVRWWTDRKMKGYYKRIDANSLKPNIDFSW